MKISICIAVLNSHEIVRRQLLHFKAMDLPDDVEIIFADDNSDPPLEGELKNFSIHQTGFKEKWTQPAARNYAVKHATGEYLIVTDIDHIITKKLIEAVRNCEFDVLRFKRQAGVLDAF